MKAVKRSRRYALEKMKATAAGTAISSSSAKCCGFAPAANMMAKAVITSSVAVPRSGWRSTRAKQMPTKNKAGAPARRIERAPSSLAANMCANIKMSANFANSDGSNETAPFENQRCAPPSIVPKRGIKTATRRPTASAYSHGAAARSLP